MNDWSLTLAAWLLDFGLLSTAVLAMAIGLRCCWRDPAQRVAMAWGTWLGLVMLAAIAALPQWPRISLQQPSVQPPAAVVLVEPAILQLPAKEIAASLPSELVPPETSPPIAPNPALPWQSGVAVAWLAIAGLSALWIAAGMWQTWRLVRRSTDAPAWIAGELEQIVGKRRPPRVRLSERLTSAAAVGAIAPRILLPAAAGCPSQRPLVRAALAHEWAHIRHGDLWLLALERLLLPLLAWQPLFWWLRRSVRLDLELLADAAAAGEQPLEYAEALVAWARTSGRAAAGLAALSLWESPHTLSRRVTMLLDSRRPFPPRGSRRWQFLLAAVTLAIIGGLSLVTLRPQSADGQEAQPAAEAASAGSTDKTPTMIALQCLILEADRDELAEVLPVVEKRWQPDAETDITLHQEGPWQQRLKALTAKKGTAVLSRPQIQTLDGQVGVVQIGGEGLPPSTDAPDAAQPKVLGLRIELTPRLTLDNYSRQIALDYDIRQVDLKQNPEGLPTNVERKVTGKAVLPLDGQTLIIAHRPQKAELRPLVIAVKGFVMQREADTVQEAPPARTGDLQRVVRQLERQLAERRREAESQRNQSEVLRKQVDDLKAELAVLKKGNVQELRTYYPKYARAEEAAEILRTLMEQMQSLTGDPQLAAIKITPNPKLNALHVQGSYKSHSAIEAILEKLDAKPVGSVGDPNAVLQAKPGNLQELVRRSHANLTAPEAAPTALADRETQVQLLKLDLQEAEIGLRAAQKDMSRVQALQQNNAISQEEVAKHEFQVQAAEIKVMRARIVFEGMMRQMARPQNEPQPNPQAQSQPVPELRPTPRPAR